MVAYRFCRPDDVGLLVRAINECYLVHFPEQRPLKIADFQLLVRELNVWPSNCMVAREGPEPVSVCIATRREREVLIYQLGTRVDFQCQGHARHLLTSLSQKLAVLGPTRMVVECPTDWTPALELFRSLGYRDEASLTDFLLASPLTPPESLEPFVPVSVEDLAEGDQLDAGKELSWERQTQTLLNRKERIDGLAVVGSDALDAFVLCLRPEKDTKSRQIVRLMSRRPDHAEALLGLLMRACCGGFTGPVMIPRIEEREVPFSVLESIGFRSVRTYLRLAGEASFG